jgi:hypothetical protein
MTRSPSDSGRPWLEAQAQPKPGLRPRFSLEKGTIAIYYIQIVILIQVLSHLVNELIYYLNCQYPKHTVFRMCFLARAMYASSHCFSIHEKHMHGLITDQMLDQRQGLREKIHLHIAMIYAFVSFMRL